jgi:hypothetical protein
MSNYPTASEEKQSLLLATSQSIQLPAYIEENDEEPEVIDKSLIIHLIVCSISVAFSLYFYGKLILKCIMYLNSNGAQVHHNTALGLLVGSLGVAGVVLGLFLHAVSQTLRLTENKHRYVQVASV